MEREEIFKKIIHCLTSILNEDATAILFGSQARGDYRPESDWDLLIILEKKESLNYEEIGSISFPLYCLSAEINIELNPIIISKSDWEKRSFIPLYNNIKKEGIKIWG